MRAADLAAGDVWHPVFCLLSLVQIRRLGGIRLDASERNGLDAIDRETVNRPVQVLALDAVKALRLHVILSRNTFCRHFRSLQPDPAPEVIMGFVADVGYHAALRHRRFRFPP